MSSTFKPVLFGLCGLALLVIAASAYLGAFAPVRVEERVTGPFLFVYQETSSHDPREVGRITTELHAALSSLNTGEMRPFDVYGPNATEVGFVILSADRSLLGDLAPPTRVREVPAERSMVARFPWRHQLSFLVGYYRVAPKLRRHREGNGYGNGPAYALNEGATIAYIQPIIEDTVISR